MVGVFGGLVDKSLVVRLPGSGRYRLLETIRVFARDRLEEAGEAAGVRAPPPPRAGAGAVGVPRLDRWLSARRAAAYRADLDDARQAFRRSLEQGEARDAVEIAVGASFLWRNAIGCAEGDSWVAELAARTCRPTTSCGSTSCGPTWGRAGATPGQMFAAPRRAAGPHGRGRPGRGVPGRPLLGPRPADRPRQRPAPALHRALDLARRPATPGSSR